MQTTDRQWQTENTVEGNSDSLDLDRPRGLHVYQHRGASVVGNPGLLSLMIPHPLPNSTAEWEVSVLSFLTPPSRSVRWYADEHGLRLHNELTDIRIGERTVPARRLEFRRRAGNAHVSPEGVVLRVDLNTPLLGFGERWIRLLDPSEY